MYRTLLPLLVLLVGCSRAPPAPQELDDLCAWLFTYFEDDQAMEEGLDNLYTWLNDGDNLDQTLEGYEVNLMTEEAINALDDTERTTANLIGAAVGTAGTGVVYDVAYALIVVEPEELSPGMYEVYDRSVVEGSYDAFMDGDDPFLQVYNYMESVFAGGLAESTVETNGQYRWHEMTHGTAMVQRTWMEMPAEFVINVDLFPDVSINEQFYLNVVMPYQQGSLRLQTTWFDFTLDKEGCAEDPTQDQCQLEDWQENMAISNFIGSMQDVYVDVDDWAEEYGTGGTVSTGGCSTSPRRPLLGGLGFLAAGLAVACRRRSSARGSTRGR